MLIKRTNILFEEKTWELLTALASRNNQSVGELVRKAIKKTYFPEGEKMTQKQALTKIIAIRKKTKGKINYRQLIEDGRKY